MDATNTNTNAAQAPQQNTASTPTQTGAANPGSTEAKFTQADLDRLINERLQRDEGRTERLKAEAKADFLKQLGLPVDADPKTVKATIEKAREKELADLSATERAEKLVAAEKTRADALEAQLNAERAERRHDRIAQAVTSKATAMKANDTEDVLLYAREKHKEELNGLMDESGAIDDKKLTALLDKIKAAKGHYFTPPVTTPGSMSNNGGRTTPNSNAAQEDLMKRFRL